MEKSDKVTRHSDHSNLLYLLIMCFISSEGVHVYVLFVVDDIKLK